MYNSQEIALKIKETAKIRKISIKQLLEKCDLNINYISELGKGKQASALNISKIADYLNVSVDYLLGREQQPSNVNQVNNGNVGDNPNVNVSNLNKIELDEMSQELLKKFKELPFDDKLEVFNYIKSKKGA